jgi:hypothetical protein
VSGLRRQAAAAADGHVLLADVQKSVRRPPMRLKGKRVAIPAENLYQEMLEEIRQHFGFTW